MTTNSYGSDLEAQQVALEDDGEAERLPITAAEASSDRYDSPRLSPRSSAYYYACCSWRFLLAAACLLLSLDVILRVSEYNKSSSNHRWVPQVDILNASNKENLKYTRDVGNSGLQGLAVHDNVLYQVHTMALRVLQLDDSTGNVVDVQAHTVYDANDFPPLLHNATVAHIGGVDLSYSQEHGSELWLATHSDGLNGQGGLFAVDLQTLHIKPSRKVLVDYNLDWVAFHNGVLYFGEFFNVKVVHRVSIDTLENLGDLQLVLPEHLQEGGIDFVQSAAFDFEGQLVLLGDDYQCTVYFVNVASGEVVRSQPLLLGSETDGITFDHRRRSMLVGYNRQHSHEQVMGLEPMVSIIKLVQQ